MDAPRDEQGTYSIGLPSAAGSTNAKTSWESFLLFAPLLIENNKLRNSPEDPAADSPQAKEHLRRHKAAKTFGFAGPLGDDNRSTQREINIGINIIAHNIISIPEIPTRIYLQLKTCSCRYRQRPSSKAKQSKKVAIAKRKKIDPNDPGALQTRKNVHLALAVIAVVAWFIYSKFFMAAEDEDNTGMA
jgi:hypothetical protein